MLGLIAAFFGGVVAFATTWPLLARRLAGWKLHAARSLVAGVGVGPVFWGSSCNPMIVPVYLLVLRWPRWVMTHPADSAIAVAIGVAPIAAVVAFVSACIEARRARSDES